MIPVLVIDGNAILHRAYHALPPLNTPDGTPANAVYGFTSMLLRLAQDFKPQHIIAAFDRPTPTFRKALYDGYQSKRPEMDDTLKVQIPLVYDVVSSFGIPIIGVDGYEADDVIGTVAHEAHNHKLVEAPDHPMLIVTGDKDILQLVSDDVLVYMPVKGLSEGKVYASDDVYAKLGVRPEQIPDYKALAGDNSDNYPGVLGIGPKTAVNLIQAYGTIEALYAALKKDSEFPFSSGVKEKLRTGHDMSVLSKDLATIRKNVPIDTDIRKLPPYEFHTAASEEIFLKFGFHSLLRRIATFGEEPQPKEQKKKSAKKPQKEEKEQLSLV